MDLKELETKWRTALSSILDELTEEHFRKLLCLLEKIPQGLKEGRVRGDMPSVIIQYYGTEGSIAVIDNLVKFLPRLDAAVQQPLEDMKELLKLREKKKRTKPAADSGAAPKKKKPAAAATSKQTDSGAAAKKKKPAAAATSNQTDSGAAAKKKKPAAEVSGETQIMGRGLTLNPAWFLPNPKVPVRAVEPQQKEPAGDTLKPKAQSAAPLQTRKIKVITLLRTNKTNAHLQVQFEDGLQEVYGKTEVLSEGMGFKSVEEFNKGFFHMLPLTVTAHMQGKRILEMRMI